MIVNMPNGTDSYLKCPICGAPADKKYTPFCSRHCADVDLSRWLKGVYAVPSVENDLEEEENVPEK